MYHFSAVRQLFFPMLLILNLIGNREVPFNSIQCLPALWNFSLKLSVVTYHTQGVVFDYRVLVRMKMQILSIIILLVCSFNPVLYPSSLKPFFLSSDLDLKRLKQLWLFSVPLH